jgi:endonuclease-8
VTAASPQGRFAAGAAAVDGHRLDAVEAWGKHLLQRFGDAGTVHTHLGMRGITLRSAPPVPPKPQVRLRLATADVAWDLIAPATCELLDRAGVERLLAGLGPDPLRADADVERVRRGFHDDQRALGTVLLDQSVLAGVGNVFRAEALHALGLHPATPAADIDDDTFHRLWAELVAEMRRGVEDGAIVTRPPSGKAVYKQDACADCGTPVATSSLGGRTMYACPRCQPAVRAAGRTG